MYMPPHNMYIPPHNMYIPPPPPSLLPDLRTRYTLPSGRYDENWSSLIGIVTAIVGNVLISFALNTQRYAHIRLEREARAVDTSKGRAREAAKSSASGATSKGTSGEERPLLAGQTPGRDEGSGSPKSYLQSPYWWAGIVLMTIGEAGNFLAYGFAPASIVSPLGVVALISNCIIAPFMLKERFRWRDAVGVVVAVGGAVTVVLSASDNNPKLGPDEIWQLITRWEFETYLGVTTGVIVLLVGASNRYGDKNILIDLGLVGLFGGFTALSTKGVASLLSYTLWRVITFPVFYLLVAILVATAVMQIKYINRALQRFDATQVIPVQFVLFTLSVILGSAILYRDFERTSGGDAGKFVGGCALTFSGVWLITSGRPRRDDDDDDDPESSQAINLPAPYRDTDTTSASSSSTIRPSSPTKPHSPSRPTTPTIKLTSPPATPPHLPLANPWSTPSPTKPSISRHTSTPVLPSEAAPASVPAAATAPRTPSRGKSHDELPTTPGALTPGAATGPGATGLRRTRTAHRASIPALLASPLSTSLSALVQDLKRRESVGVARDADARRGSALALTDDVFGEPLSRRSTQGERPGTGGARWSGWSAWRGGDSRAGEASGDAEQ